MSNEALSEQTIDYFVSLMTEPRKRFDKQKQERKELQRAYESLVVSKNGHRRHSRYSRIAERAREGDVNALSFLEFVARQLEEKDNNNLWKAETRDPDAKPQSNAELQPSPLARKLRLQYSEELARMPTLQIDALWNEILLYAKKGFDSLKARNTQSAAFATYQIPQITETPTLDFLLLPLITAGSSPLISLREFDRQYLEDGRVHATNRPYSDASYAAILVEKASSVMEQIAKIHGIDISPKIHRKNYLVYKMEGGSFIQYFETSGRKDLDRFAAKGEASLVFYETASVVERARKYKIPLELLITADEINALKQQAVNHPEKGLRGELLGIARTVASGDWLEAGRLLKTDEFLPYSDDRSLVAAYKKIRSAIKTLSDSTYRALHSKTTQVSLETSIDAAEPVAISARTASVTVPQTPYSHKSTYPQIAMNDADAKAILSMFESGNLEGIVNYKLQPATPGHAPPYTSKTPVYGTGGRRAAAHVVTGGIGRGHSRSGISYRKRFTMGGGVVVAAAILGLISLFYNSNHKSQTAEENKPIEVSCDDIPTSQYRTGSGIGPIFVCKPSEELRLQETMPSTISPEFKWYYVVKGDNLTHIVKRQLGIRDEHDAYLTALEQAKSHGIKNPNLIYPGQVLRLKKVPLL